MAEETTPGLIDGLKDSPGNRTIVQTGAWLAALQMLRTAQFEALLVSVDTVKALDFVHAVRKAHPSMAILVLSDLAGEGVHARLLELGVARVLERSPVARDVITALICIERCGGLQGDMLDVSCGRSCPEKDEEPPCRTAESPARRT